MAAEEERKVEIDSLFEGMVLFNPSQMADDDQLLQEQPHPQPNPIVPQTPPPSDSNWAGTSLPASQPLDENLFSDLTLITPSPPLENQLSLQPQSDTSTTSSTSDNATTATTSNREVLSSSSSVSRQISSRKKRRAGLRIGYGRDVPIPDDQPHGSAAAPTAQQRADGRLSLEPERPPPPSSSFAPESESGGSAPQPQLKEHGPSIPDTQIATFSFTPGQPVRSSSTTALERDFLVNTRKEDDPSHASAGNGSQDDDNLVLDAQHSADLQAGNHQLSTHSPIELMSSEQIRAHISQKLRRVRELIASVSAARKDATRRRRNAAEALNLASSSYRKLEKALEEACEAEDFETAERVSESLASAEKEKESLAIGLRLAEADCDSVDAKMQEVLEGQIAAEEECASLLKNFAMEAANDADVVLKNAEVASGKEMDKWISLTEDLELKKTELEIESCLINAARLVLSDSIEHSVNDDRRERELLCKRKEMLTEELEKLLALVKEKEAEIAETDCNIETVEKRIIDVVSGFQEVQLSVDAKYDNLQAGLSQMELDNEALTRKKKEIDDCLSQEKDRGAKLQQLSQVSTDEANMYQEAVELRKSLVLFILKSREDKVRLAKTEEKLSEDVHMLIQEISAARASLQDLSSTRSSFQQEIEFLKQRLVFIDKRIPELEAEKKVAAAARNFKEAARIATESKALNVEKEGLQIKTAVDVLELGKIEEEISNTVRRLHETERQISTKEKEVAMARFQRLLLIAGAAKAERSTSLELGDVKEADALLAEAEAAESEARKIQLVYNFKEEEFANLPKQYISMELVSSLGGEQLAELAAFASCKSI